MHLRSIRSKTAAALISSMLITNVVPFNVWADFHSSIDELLEEMIDAKIMEEEIVDEEIIDEDAWMYEEDEEEEVTSQKTRSSRNTASSSDATRSDADRAEEEKTSASTSTQKTARASSSNAAPAGATPSDATPSDATPSDANSALKFWENEAGPVIGTTVKGVIQDEEGRYFKDSNGNGELDAYEDWTLDPQDRAEALVKEMSLEELAGMMMISTRFTGLTSGKYGLKTDETGLLDEDDTGTLAAMVWKVFGIELRGGTTTNIEEYHIRHFILRENPDPYSMASWVNQMNMKAEGTSLGIPVLIASNSRNENGEATFGMNDASGVFSTWPGTLGLAAAVRGDIAMGKDASLIDRFAEIARSEWDACGLKKGYMYMADTMTDPRWQRTYGTFGEDPELNADIIRRIVTGFQGEDGLEADGIALTVKHFPGGGARENGFDPHYKLGKWNVYQTEGSLEAYHLPAFQAAIDAGVSAIMPYYAIPSESKSVTQYDKEGNPIPMRSVGFAFNQYFIDTLLRGQMNFEGYVNSDSGITRKMDHGVETLTRDQKTALAINAGTDIIGDINAVEDILDAYEKGPDGTEADYYDNHPVPDGYTREELTLTKEALERSNVRLLTEMFQLGLFENPYRDPEMAEITVENEGNWEEAYEAHQKSVVLLKNEGQVLPLTEDKLSGKKIYVQYFAKENSEQATQQLQTSLELYGFDLTGNYEEADYALLFVRPSSGETFNATPGYLELDICTGKEVHDVDEDGRPIASVHLESTIENADQIIRIADAIHANGGKVITNVNFTLAWLLGNVEPYSDALLAGFETFTEATMDVILGEYAPTGRMPITLPKDDTVIAVDENGICISHNDIPGYAKDQYMPDSMKDENGAAYAYRDAAGNYYTLDFGLSYEKEPDIPDEPDEPDTPDEPAVPDKPEVPDKPAVPQTPVNSQSSSGHHSHDSSTAAGSAYEAGSWVQNEKGWWFRFSSGTWPAGRWLQQPWAGQDNWYYFNEDGYMATGWLEFEGNRYYLHPTADGNQGAMYTGWHLIDGIWYYFNEQPDGTKGRLLRNTTTPDGFLVGENGAWIP